MKTTTNNSKIAGSVLLLACSVGSLFSQNMIMNEGMGAKCIHAGDGQIVKTDTWTNANGGTVDLYDVRKPKCTMSNGIPQNYMGHQAAYTSGHNYAGLVAYYDDGSNNVQDSLNNARLGLKDGYKQYSEYLQGELSEPLVAGKVYQVAFRVSLAERSGRAVSNFGALLTKDKLEERSNAFLKYTPQFISYRVIADTTDWVTLYGAYIAEGGEKYITIGCFKDSYMDVVKTVGPGQNDSRKAYYYVSDVTVGPYASTPLMEPIVLGVDYVELMDLQFASGSSTIESKFNNELDGVATWMKQHPEMSFFVAGYTDKTGSDAINDPLSLSRAHEVKKYLVSKGVKEENLVTEGFGSENPIDYKIKSRKNRRVEVYLYSINTVSQR